MTTSPTKLQKGIEAPGRRVVLAEYFVDEERVYVFGVRSDLKEPEVAQLDLDREKLRSFVLANFGPVNRDWTRVAGERDLAVAGRETEERRLDRRYTQKLWIGLK